LALAGGMYAGFSSVIVWYIPRVARRQDIPIRFPENLATFGSHPGVVSRDKEADARQAKVLTADEAWRIARNIARLPELLGRGERD
jgi:hypothetical protein